jgi:serralysin
VLIGGNEGLFGGDRVFGGAGDDTIEGGRGNDTVDGGEGFDTALFVSSSRAVTVNLDANTSTAGGSDFFPGDGIDSVVGFERVLGSRFGDSFIGSNRAETFDGRLGADTIDGGGGFDTVEFGMASSGVVASLTTGVVSGGAGEDRLANIENLAGSVFGDRFTGTARANRLDGRDGDDTLSGGEGADVLIGGAGADDLRGGGGADRFVFGATSHSAPTTRDRILDFTRGQDKIDLRAIDADTDGTPGDQAFAFIGARAFGGVDSQLRFAGGVLSGDVNGDRIADFAVSLTGVVTLGAADLLL